MLMQSKWINSFYPAKSNLALLFYEQGKLKEAENLYLDLIENHSEYTQGEYYLGILYAEQKKYKEAAEVLEKATLKSDVNPRIYYNLGLIYQYLNNNSKAESSLLKANQLSQNEFDVLYALADFYIKKQDYSSALEYAKEISRMYPTNSAGQQLIAYITQVSIK